MFTYCNNNPINMLDSTGNRPGWIEGICEGAEAILEEAKNRLAHTFYIMGRIVTSPFKAMEANVGFGIGLGADATFNINGISVTAGASASTTDSVVFENGSFDARSTSSANFGTNVADIFDMGHELGVQHSFFDEQCTCDVWTDPYAYRADCPANRPISGTSKTIGFSFGLFLIIGVDISVGINLSAWGQELNDIADASFAYGG